MVRGHGARWVIAAAVGILAGCVVDEGPPDPAPDYLGHPPLKRPPANVVGGFKIAVPPVTLMPGEEQQPCFIFPLEIQGPSTLVGGGSLTVGAGMHHGNVNTRPKTGEGIRPCPADEQGGEGFVGFDILKGGAVLFGSSTQVAGTEWQSFPDGMGYRLREGFEIIGRMHYLNTTSAPITVAPVYAWFTIDEASLKQEINAFAWQYTNIEIPPNSQATATGACNFPAPMHLVTVLPHMHKLGTAFTGTYLGGPRDGQLFLDSRGYDPENGVMVEYDQAVDLSQGAGASFACTWHNTLNKTIKTGVGDNEMCILFGYAYPPENAFSANATDQACIYVAPPLPSP